MLHNVPLFPLDLVLFPRMALPLHIFEQRYRLMVKECLENKTPFGIILLEEGPSVTEEGLQDAPGEPVPVKVGTLARIVEMVKLGDGRMLVTTVGTERFRLLNYYNEKPYLTGDIELWPEEAGCPSNELEELGSKVQIIFKEYINILKEEPRNLEQKSSPLSYNPGDRFSKN